MNPPSFRWLAGLGEADKRSEDTHGFCRGADLTILDGKCYILHDFGSDNKLPRSTYRGTTIRTSRHRLFDLALANSLTSFRRHSEVVALNRGRFGLIGGFLLLACLVVPMDQARILPYTNMLFNNKITVLKTIPFLVDRVVLSVHNHELSSGYLRPTYNKKLIQKFEDAGRLHRDRRGAPYIEATVMGYPTKFYTGAHSNPGRPSFAGVISLNANREVRQLLINAGRYDAKNDVPLDNSDNYIVPSRLINRTPADVFQIQVKWLWIWNEILKSAYKNMAWRLFHVNLPEASTGVTFSYLEIGADVESPDALRAVKKLAPVARQTFQDCSVRYYGNSIAVSGRFDPYRRLCIYPKTTDLLRFECRLNKRGIRRLGLLPYISEKKNAISNNLRQMAAPYRQNLLDCLADAQMSMRQPNWRSFIDRLPNFRNSQTKKEFMNRLIHCGKVSSTRFRYLTQQGLLSRLLVKGARGYPRINPRFNSCLDAIRSGKIRIRVKRPSSLSRATL